MKYSFSWISFLHYNQIEQRVQGQCNLLGQLDARKNLEILMKEEKKIKIWKEDKRKEIEIEIENYLLLILCQSRFVQSLTL